MYNINSSIQVTEKEITWGRCERYYNWVGPKSGLAYVNRRFYKDLPFRTRIVDTDYLRNGYIVALSSGANLFTAVLHKINAILCHAKMFVKARIILTAMVWGLAYVPDSEIPSWKHMLKSKERR